MGERPIRKWASLVALAGMGDDKPAELVVTALIRARFAELLGEGGDLGDRASDLFLVGLFSLLDALVDQPMADSPSPAAVRTPPADRSADPPNSGPIGCVFDLEPGITDRSSQAIGLTPFPFLA